MAAMTEVRPDVKNEKQPEPTHFVPKNSPILEWTGRFSAPIGKVDNPEGVLVYRATSPETGEEQSTSDGKPIWRAAEILLLKKTTSDEPKTMLPGFAFRTPKAIPLSERGETFSSSVSAPNHWYNTIGDTDRADR